MIAVAKYSELKKQNSANEKKTDIKTKRDILTPPERFLCHIECDTEED